MGQNVLEILFKFFLEGSPRFQPNQSKLCIHRRDYISDNKILKIGIREIPCF